MNFVIPQAVKNVVEKLTDAGHTSYLVGGSVRDLLSGVEPEDWDIATKAKPEEVLKLFPDGVYENEFGTVFVPVPPRHSEGVARRISSERLRDPSLALRMTDGAEKIEITTFRTEEKYTDKRHPDAVRFAETIEEDLARRDFTINAVALSTARHSEPFDFAQDKLREESHGTPRDSSVAALLQNDGERGYEIIDPFNGQNDLENGVIRAVGKPGDRFQEDALRLMRAVRFATQLGFEIEAKTLAAIKENAHLIRAIAKERIRDEFIKIMQADEPHKGVFLLQETGLLKHILPELEAGVGVAQNKHHIYSVFEHNVYSLMYAAKYGYGLAVRIASLFHDAAKPQTKRGQGPDATFYNHDIVGARVAARIMERFRFPRDLGEKVVTLVRYHLFYYDVGVVTASSVRRLLRKVGPGNIQELLQVRMAERKGSGVPKARPYRLRHFEFMLEKVQRDPISVKMLAVNGQDVMTVAGIKSSPRVGWILNALLEEVLDDPSRNEKDYLVGRIAELDKLSDADLQAFAEKGKEKKEALEETAEGKIKKKYWVK